MDITNVVQARGRVTAKRETPLLFSESGILHSVDVSEGDRVEAGERLAELKAPEIERKVLERKYDLNTAQLTLARAEESNEFELAKAQADVALAQAQYDQAVLNGDMAIEQVIQNAAEGQCGNRCDVHLENAETQKELAMQIAGAELQKTRISYNQTAAAQDEEIALLEEQVKLAEELYLQAAEQLSDTLLMAPFSGMVTDLTKQVGTQVQAYEAIGTIANLSELRIIAQVPTAQLGQVAQGSSVALYLDAQPEQAYDGTVIQIGGQPVSWQGQSVYEVTIEFDAGQDVPASLGMGTDVILSRETKENVLVIPNEAILSVAGQAYVELVQDNNETEQIEVDLGVTDGAMTEIVAGLKAGQVIRIP
jgi:HlyD family secretion protein